MHSIFSRKSIFIIFLSVLAFIWLMVTTIENVIYEGISFIDLLILNTPDMLILHRGLFILLGLFLTSLMMMYKIVNRLHQSERDLKELNQTKNKFFSIYG